MNKFKKTLIWSVINDKHHPKLTEDERKISGTMPIIDKLFPGINYYSITGFYQVSNDYLRPVLTKLFPYLKGLDAEKVRKNEKIEIENAFLPSKGYEHLDNPEWKERLEELLKN
jgi:hypothetical protein